MLVSTVILYFYVRGLLQEEVEEELYSTEARIESVLKEKGPPYTLPPIVEIESVAAPGPEILKDTVLFDPSQDEMEDFRELTTYKNIQGKIYRITVRNLIVESEDILIAIVISYLIIIFLVFISLFYFNRAINKKIWDPFFKNLEQMKRFSLASEKEIQLLDSDILEFTELNKEIITLTEKVRSDYKNLKQFTEDVSHEMQTPLAIIQAKIENVINENTLNENQYEQFTSIQKDIKRLTQLNKRLTLLTKIDNRQFGNVEKVRITNLVKDSVQNFSEPFPVSIEYASHNEIIVSMDPYLAEILCSNLISNAIKHTKTREAIKIRAEGRTLTITNQGEEAIKHPDQLYSRFYRESSKTNSTGLGLAIVKKICDLYGYKISYDYKEGWHIFEIKFI